MKKLKLRIETLAVESFESMVGPAAPGTVRGHSDATIHDTCTYNRDCWTQLNDCSYGCTGGGWTCGIGC